MECPAAGASSEHKLSDVAILALCPLLFILIFCVCIPYFGSKKPKSLAVSEFTRTPAVACRTISPPAYRAQVWETDTPPAYCATMGLRSFRINGADSSTSLQSSSKADV